VALPHVTVTMKTTPATEFVTLTHTLLKESTMVYILNYNSKISIDVAIIVIVISSKNVTTCRGKK